MRLIVRSAAALLSAAMLALLAGCSGVDVGVPPAVPSRLAVTPSPATQAVPDARTEAPSALRNRYDPRLPSPLIDPDKVQSGGPPPDGIPAIDKPTFTPADKITWLQDDDPVLSLTVGGESRAYPLRVMTWHEIVNDTVGGIAVAVTYCPLCNSGVAFQRELEGRVLSFGTSGMLYADNLVMYDRQTESLWPQLTGQASIGMLTGKQLTAIPMGVVGWTDFRRAHPTALVLSDDTGFDRPYGTNPYAGYDDPNGQLLFALPDAPDKRLPVKERVVGIAGGTEHVAIVRRALVGQEPLDVVVGDRHLVVWHRPGQSSALDADTVAGGVEVGTIGVFVPVVEGRRLGFERVGNGFRDTETGSWWDVLGHSVDGPLKGKRLTPYQHLDTFWFAWATFHPDTDLVK